LRRISPGARGLQAPLTMFAPMFHGNLASFGDTIVDHLPPAVSTISGAELLGNEDLDALLGRFAADRGCSEIRATASQWSKYFFAYLIIPVTVVQLHRGRAFDLALSDMRIALHDDATPRAFHLGSATTTGTDDTVDDGADFSSLMDTALTPVIDTLADRCRLSPRVFWSNAAMYYDWVLGQLAAQDDVPHSRLAAARSWLAQPRRADGRRNPFHAPFRDCPPGACDGDGAPTTQCRRLCCMRDLDPLWGLCANCPRAITVTPALTAG